MRKVSIHLHQNTHLTSGSTLLIEVKQSLVSLQINKQKFLNKIWLKSRLDLFCVEFECSHRAFWCLSTV